MGVTTMARERYPILDISDRLEEAAGWLDGATDALGNHYVDEETGQEIPTPQALDEASRLWEQAWELTCRARALLKPLAEEEQKQYDEDDDHHTRYQ